MAMSSDQIKLYIKKAFPDATIDIKDLAGDDEHFAATVTSTAFRGKTRIQQHKMVYEALEGQVGTTLHALSLKTLLPKE